jgi:hypothetical protein
MRGKLSRIGARARDTRADGIPTEKHLRTPHLQGAVDKKPVTAHRGCQYRVPVYVYGTCSGGGKPEHVPEARRDQAASLTSIFLAPAFAGFRILMRKTPLVAKDRALWVFSVIANLFRLQERIFFAEPNDGVKLRKSCVDPANRALTAVNTCAEFSRPSNSATILRRGSNQRGRPTRDSTVQLGGSRAGRLSARLSSMSYSERGSRARHRTVARTEFPRAWVRRRKLAGIAHGTTQSYRTDHNDRRLQFLRRKSFSDRLRAESAGHPLAAAFGRDDLLVGWWRDPAERNPPHSGDRVAQHGERVLSRGPIRRDIIGLEMEELVDLLLGDEHVDVDDVPPVRLLIWCSLVLSVSVVAG